MNWLDASEVEAWLKMPHGALGGFEFGVTSYALLNEAMEQFVRSLSDTRVIMGPLDWIYVDEDDRLVATLSTVQDVARLLVKAMEEK